MCDTCERHHPRPRRVPKVDAPPEPVMWIIAGLLVGVGAVWTHPLFCANLGWLCR